VNIKNHVWQDGQLLQTNKKWSALKQIQRSWIQEMTAKEHAAYVEEHGKLPMKKSKEAVLDKVHDHINERGIWIPYGEFKSHVSVMIDRLNRKNPLFKPPTKASKPQKPAILKVGIEDFPDDVQLEVKEMMEKLILSYKSQARHVPYNKTRSRHIKLVLSKFNSTLWQIHGRNIMKNQTLLDFYDEVRNQHK